MSGSIMGRVHSIQSMGALDGPGIRFVVFVHGCNLRCGCCHNPDTWAAKGGREYAPAEIVKRAARYREYFGSEGGLTISGGEPLLQADFAAEVFRLCHAEGINTCLDTSGSIMNERVMALLKETDRVLLDIKYTDDALYRAHVGCAMQKPLDFLEYLDAHRIPTTIRQVIIPTLNADEANISRLRQVADAHECVDGVELLPFRKMCKMKYESMGIEFPFASIPEPDAGTMRRLEKLL